MTLLITIITFPLKNVKMQIRKRKIFTFELKKTNKKKTKKKEILHNNSKPENFLN